MGLLSSIDAVRDTPAGPAAGSTAASPAPSLAPSLVVLYDGTCGFCTRQARFAQKVVGASRIELVSTAQPGVRERYGLSDAATDRQLHAVDPRGQVLGGAAAIARIVRAVPVAGVVGWLYYLPGIRQAADAVYRWISRHRYQISRRLGWQALPDDTCAGGACAPPPGS